MQIKRTKARKYFAQGIHRLPGGCYAGITGKIGKIIKSHLSGKEAVILLTFTKLTGQQTNRPDNKVQTLGG